MIIFQLAPFIIAAANAGNFGYWKTEQAADASAKPLDISENFTPPSNEERELAFAENNGVSKLPPWLSGIFTKKNLNPDEVEKAGYKAIGDHGFEIANSQNFVKTSRTRQGMRCVVASFGVSPALRLLHTSQSMKPSLVLHTPWSECLLCLTEQLLKTRL